MSKSPVSAREQERIRTRYKKRKDDRERRNQESLQQYNENMDFVMRMSSIEGQMMVANAYRRGDGKKEVKNVSPWEYPYYEDEFGRSQIDFDKLNEMQRQITEENLREFEEEQEEKNRVKNNESEFDGFLKPGAPVYDVNSVWPAKQIGTVDKVESTDDGVYISGTLNDPHFVKQLKSVGFTDFSINEAWHHDYKRKENGFGKFWRNFKRALNPRNWFE